MANIFIENRKIQCYTIINKSFALYKQFKDISIFMYVLKVLAFRNITNDQWDCLESKLYNLWTKFPSLSKLFIKMTNIRGNIHTQ